MNKKIKYAIIIYILLLLISYKYKPELYDNNQSKFIVPCTIIILSIISYYLTIVFIK